MVKETDSWLACHEFEPSTADDLLCREDRCNLTLSRLKSPPIGVMWKFGEGVSAQVSYSLLEHGSKSREMSPKDLVQLDSVT
ncbi:hypothetical protein TNCV_3826351 [Trichonephila clavipes]|nr:hypothetical protein TNCV_3826351 [Trichonephila clavipes]